MPSFSLGLCSAYQLFWRIWWSQEGKVHTAIFQMQNKSWLHSWNTAGIPTWNALNMAMMIFLMELKVQVGSFQLAISINVTGIREELASLGTARHKGASWFFSQPRVPSHTTTEEEELGIIWSSNLEAQDLQMSSSDGMQEEDPRNWIWEEWGWERKGGLYTMCEM